MHREMLKDATLEQLREFANYAISEAKFYDDNLYSSYEMCLYKMIYGYHFSKWILEKALSTMKNEDGTKGGHWSISDTNSVAKQYGIPFTDFNEYDWNYVMNMVYSDYYGIVPNELSAYVKIANKFINDKDGGDGKAFRYYIAMNYDKLY